MTSTIIDEYKIFPRIIMLMNNLTYQAVHWYMSLPDDYQNITQAAGLVSFCMGAFTGCYGIASSFHATLRSTVSWCRCANCWYMLFCQMEQGSGSNFLNVLEDKTRMSRVLEDFLRNFYKLELPRYTMAAKTCFGMRKLRKKLILLTCQL